jgi:hypothetical protein
LVFIAPLGMTYPGIYVIVLLLLNQIEWLCTMRVSKIKLRFAEKLLVLILNVTLFLVSKIRHCVIVIMKNEDIHVYI